ncbi:MAG: alpha/beta hydrolase [Proteobacteria bacterium]|nr:alpha/beta hydrolase [Pseudomonadota bacterium]
MIERLYGAAERVGLNALNVLARLGDYERRTLSFGPDPRQQLDWYRGEGAGRPLVFFLYGGNWRSGQRQDYRFVADTLVSLGCDVVIPDYRLYPAARFVEIFADVCNAFARVVDLADTERLIVLGHSAGAHMGALLTLNTEIPATDRIKGFIGLAGPYDFFPFRSRMHWDLFHPPHHGHRLQPVNFVRASAPPLYLLHGADDTRVRRGHSKALLDRQLAAGGRVDREVYENMGHVDIILSFSALHRSRSKVIEDIRTFIHEDR